MHSKLDDSFILNKNLAIVSLLTKKLGINLNLSNNIQPSAILIKYVAVQYEHVRTNK
ncbi:hypothetical protein ARADI_0258 [Arsenophonus endosymbiont of Aleurodicus dispersus]|nr:hypothetical protein ARADI_0258 [Arsenophonus endosymbiont of Aleurodicus dispersus]